MIMEYWKHMNFKNKIITLIFILLAAFNFTMAQDCKATITINTNNDSSLIFLNDNFIGKGNVSVEESTGSYSIKVTKSLIQWDAQTIHDTIYVSNCEDQTLNYTFNNSIYLQTDPEDAYVYHDQKLIGHTPLRLAINNQDFLLKKIGYEDKIISSNQLDNGKTISLVQLYNNKNQESFFDGTEFKLLLGSLIVLGGTTAYYKLKADDKFQEYQFTGKGELLDQTHKYDLISGITFGLVQINFGILMYYFLFDK